MEKCPVCNGELRPDQAVCPACGFRILGSTQKFNPISLHDENDQPEVAPERKPGTLTVLRGPGEISTVYSLEEREMSIGRSPNCDIFLNDMTVSRSHAVIQTVGHDYAIRDDGSFNGIWINNENITQAILNDGDLVQIGAFVLLYQR